jgi:acetate kinase
MDQRVKHRATAGDLEVLCLNGGSSSLKFALFRMGEGEALLARGAVESIGLPEGRFWLQDPAGHKSAQAAHVASHRDAAERVFAALEAQSIPSPGGIGHRIVHGGMRWTKPQQVDQRLMADLRRLIPLAPLHLPSELDVVQAALDHFPAVPQIVCFDTAFHRKLPEIAQRFPLRRNLWDEGIQRYGFHGLSYEYVLGALGPLAEGRTVIAHLGNGASLVAVKDGRPLDTTMGLTPIGGVMMGTRSGDLDPGVLLYLMRERGYDAERLDQVVQREAGLLGVSQISSDMKTLLERRESDARASEAIAMFCYSIRKNVGALAAVLGGLDTLVFTGGIGERSSPVRWEICERLGHLGVVLDAKSNAAHRDTISSAASPCTVRVVVTDEDLMIARHAQALLAAAPATGAADHDQ